MFALKNCSFCGWMAHQAGIDEPTEWCPRCGSSLAQKDVSPAKTEPATNLWGDLLVIVSLAALGYLVHAMLWREFIL